MGGVINVITRTSIDKPELTVRANAPFEGGGESFSIDGAYGLNFDTGNIALTAQYTLREDLSVGDRGLFAMQSLIWHLNPKQALYWIVKDRSINAGTSVAGCNNIYANTYLDAYNFGNRYIPSPDGVTEGGLAGYRLRRKRKLHDVS